MEYQSCVVFELDRVRYGIQTTTVQEFFFLPEVSPIADVPPEIVGVIDLRGEILPIMDLNRRLGRQPHLYQVNDTIVVVAWQGQRVGIIVNQVYGLQTITPDQITPHWKDTQTSVPFNDGFVVGLARVEGAIVTLLNPEPLVQWSTSKWRVDSNLNLNDGSNDTGNKIASEHSPTNLPSNFPSNIIPQRGLYDHLDEQTLHVLRERTDALRRSFDSQESVDTIPMAVVGLEHEYFGFSLETVYEFTDVKTITPIPCCPPHIIGNINLRGEIITLVDIRSAIDLPVSFARSQLKAIVVRMEQLIVGISVDTILDVIYIHPSQVKTESISMYSSSSDYIQGIVPYRDAMMSIVNLTKVLTSNILLVNEEV